MPNQLQQSQPSGAADTYPTSVRLDSHTIERLDAAKATTRHTRAGIINYAIDALLDYYERTGKLPRIHKTKR